MTKRIMTGLINYLYSDKVHPNPDEISNAKELHEYIAWAQEELELIKLANLRGTITPTTHD